MKRFATYLALLIFSLFVVTACGGSGGGGGGASNTFAGAYKADFTRGVPNTTMLVTIAKNGNTTFVISDSTGVLFSGTGTTTPTGHVTGTATGVAPTVGSVTIVGDLTSGTPPTMSLTLTGALADPVNLVQIQPQGITPLVGNYNGSYAGNESGTFTMTVASDGSVTGTVTQGSVTFPLQGSVAVSGLVNFAGSGSAGSATWTGTFFFVPGSSVTQGIGTWKNASETGTWAASHA
jgi:hypothetical protein